MRTRFLLFAFIMCITACFQKVAAQNVLPLNGSVSGSFPVNGNNTWQLTTNADGRIDFSLTSTAGTIVVLSLYAEDGTTSLGSFSAPGNGDLAAWSRDALAAGIYVVRVEGYFGIQGSYSLSNHLAAAPVKNDKEINDAKEQAQKLSLNATTTGHILYYDYNHYDAYDWYKIVLNDDGMLNLKLTNNSDNGTSVICDLYDIDGTTSLGITSTTNTVSFNRDGLAAGTYYVRITTYFQNGFAAYTLTNKLFTYKYAKDAEPNDAPYQAKTIPADEIVTGHIGFYQNGNARNYTDWWKINYTGSGNLTFNTNENDWLSDNGLRPYRFEVYSDTSASAIFSNYITGGGTINLSSLIPGYYWIKIATDYFNFPSDYIAYSISNTFTQGKAKIVVVSYDITGSCASTNSIIYKCSQSSAPYTVQLYKFGNPYGSKVKVSNSKITFNDLPEGSYYATVYGDGATGSAKGISDTVSLIPFPTNTNTANIQNKQAKLIWTAISCVDYYLIQYKIHGTSRWNTINTTGNVSNYILKGLTASTDYDWRIASVDSTNGIMTVSAYTNTIAFTTAASLLTGNGNQENNITGIQQAASIIVSPNPATSFFALHYNNNMQQKLNAILYNVNGKAVWSSGLMNAESLNGKQVTVSKFTKGVFYLKIINEYGVIEASTKVIVTQ